MLTARPAPERTRTKRGVPLRLSLVGLTLVLVVLGLLASGVAVTSAMKADLISRTDDGLAGAVQTWARPRDPASAPVEGPAPGPRRPPSQYYSMITIGTGDTIVNNDFSDEPDLSSLSSGNVRPTTVKSADGDGPEWRVVKASTPFGESVVATPLSDVRATLSRLMWLQFAIGALVVVAIGVLSYLLVRSSLRPLRRVEETAHAIAAGNLNMRVAEAPPNTEVGSLSGSLNTMLGQIQRAFARTAASEQQARASEEKMRRFIADASHELRTPLTSIKGFAELYKQGAVPDATDAMSRIDAEAGRMGLLVEDLLMLARLDAHRPIAHQPVDVLALATDAVHSAKAAAPQREIGIEIGATDEPPMVSGDAPRLLQVLRNLINNAIAHTPAEAIITIGVAVDRGAGRDDVVLRVTDTGQGLTPDEASHVFERFYRGDSSRHRGDGGGGSGLGLSIVAALVDAHGGTVGVDSAPGHGSTFWVRLPRLAD
ncbi:HAMP domain-containing sensor histidine kinase [Gordonia sp. ABSL11-1]|uniref:sensor histidine kinase n=1 Tax=Gordonia sp. ABSL11-1 TaxID=3053924 RepID=UPI002573C25C|nr:HAMP domain-containing sensor histidine kinase [Gordonia sp. ABSL11-1]MDL9945428.1 HAMP domain-containing sensor histidine kinase [Gordonia sp. ABSL11-1]